MDPNYVTLATFSAAFGSGDVDAIMARMTDDCVFESTGPEPDGQHHDGLDAVRAVWERLFDEARDPKFVDPSVTGHRSTNDDHPLNPFRAERSDPHGPIETVL